MDRPGFLKLLVRHQDTIFTNDHLFKLTKHISLQSIKHLHQNWYGHWLRECPRPRRNGGLPSDQFWVTINTVQEQRKEEVKDVAEMFKATMVSTGTSANDKSWYRDSGASKHVTCDMSTMSRISRLGPSMVRLASGQTHPVEGEGNVLLSYNGSINRISNLLYVTRVTKIFYQ